MRSTDKIDNITDNFNVNINTERDQAILDEILQVQVNSIDNAVSFSTNIWRLIMENKSTSFKAAATILIAVCTLLLFLGDPAEAWAIEKTIEALKKYNAAYLSGTCQIEGNANCEFEMWMRNNGTNTETSNVLVKLDNGMLVWTEDNSTYSFIPANNTVYFEKAITTGFSHWIGPELLTILSNLNDSKTIYNFDPESNREYAVLTGGIIDATGTKSFQVEFDTESKLMTSIKQWSNLHRMGKPDFHIAIIRYYKQLPDSTFEVKLPDSVVYFEKKVSIPQENIKTMSNPHDGISIEGLTREQACKKIISELYNAARENNLKMVRKLAPVTAPWTDEALKNILKIGTERQVIEIGDIIQEGTSPLGPIVVVPVTKERKDGSIWRDQLIVQFRNIDGNESCVVHGPHGLPVRIR